MKNIAWIAVVSCSLFFNCTSEFYIKKANSEISKNNVSKAEKNFKKAYLKDPNNVDVHFELFKLYYEKNNGKKLALLQLESIRQIDPDNKNLTEAFDSVYYALANKSYEKGAFEEAIDYSKRITNQFSNQEEKRYLIRDSYLGIFEKSLEGDDYLNALEAISKAVLIDPLSDHVKEKRSDLFFQLVLSNLYDENYFEALDYLDRILLEDPNNREAIETKCEIYLFIAKSYSKNKDYNRAVEFADKALSSCPGNVEIDKEKILILSDQIESLIAERKYFKALNIVNNALQSYPNELLLHDLEIDLKFNIVHYFEDRRDYLSAIEYLNNLLNTSEDTIVYNKAKRIRIDCYKEYAKVLFTKDKYREALDYVDKVLRDLPFDEDANEIKYEIEKLKGDISFSYGNHLLGKRKYELALLRFKQAYEYNPSLESSSVYQIAIVYEKSFNVDLAIEYMNRADNLGYYSYETKESSPYKLAQYYAVKANSDASNKSYYEEKALSILKGFYCSSEYNNLRQLAEVDNSFKGLEDNSEYIRWLNGKRRLRLDNFYCKNLPDLDPPVLFEKESSDQSDPYLAFYLHNSIKYTKIIDSELNPRWDGYLVYDHDFDGYNNLSINVMDYDDNEFPRGDDDFISQERIYIRGCKTNRLYQDFKSGNPNSKIFYTVTESNEKPHFENLYDRLPVPYYSASLLSIGLGGIYCLGKVYLKFYRFLFVTAIELLLQEGNFNEKGAFDIVTKYLQAKFVTDEDLDNLINNLGVVSCVYQTATRLKQAGYLNVE